MKVYKIPQILNEKIFPSMDGLRGISIIFVIIAHINSNEKAFLGQFVFGQFGVKIFFVLSGFLITTLLIKENYLNNNISLKAFYIRRIFRIIPLIILYLLVLVFLNYLFDLKIPLLSFLNSVFFVRNFPFKITNDWYTGHLWSLSVEEQFYLIFPFILSKYKHKYLKIILIIIATMSLLYYFMNNNIGVFSYNKIVRITSWIFIILISPGSICILIGSLFSILYCKFEKFFLNYMQNKFLGLFIFLFAIILHVLSKIFLSVNELIPIIINCCIAITIILNLNKNSYFAIFLNTDKIKYIGQLSYSLYIWQQLFTYNQPWQKILLVNSSLLFVVINIILLFIISYISHEYFEKFFIDYRKKLGY
jgi:peptidoglycan/LPS O-acetylase OafA/YrhL